MKNRLFFIALTLLAALFAPSCQDNDDIKSELDNLRQRISALEQNTGKLNDNTRALHKLMATDVVIVGVTPTDYGYFIELSDGEQLKIYLGETMPSLVPELGIDAQGYWVFRYVADKGSSSSEGYTRVLKAGQPVPALPQYNGESAAISSPLLKIDADGYWLISFDQGESYEQIVLDGKPIGATGDAVQWSGFFASVDYDAESSHLDIELKSGQKLTFLVKDDFGFTILGTGEDLFGLGEARYYEVSQFGVKEVAVFAPQGWTVKLDEESLMIKAPGVAVIDGQPVKIAFAATSQDGYIKTVNFLATLTDSDAWDQDAPDAWRWFKTQTSQNVLADFSYAGYMRGEQAIPEASTLGFQTFNVRDYGAVPNDNVSDRAAFLAAVAAAQAANGGIVYFPSGRYILHDESDNVAASGVPGLGGKMSVSMIITGNNIILKGDGPNESVIAMESPMLPNDPAVMYSSPTMIQLKHNTGVVYDPVLATVAEDAPAGSFDLKLSSATSGKLNAGSWICLRLMDDDTGLLAEELGGFPVPGTWTQIKSGVNVETFHQIKSKSGNTITLHEPILYPVKSQYDWSVLEYRNYSGCGVEDLCFEGKAKADFGHHDSWEDDGAYKPIDFVRQTNSWMRRVKFKSVSEASSIILSACVTVADVQIEGTNGHSSIRSQGSSRVFIGKVTDTAGGGLGQYHAVGVSKPSLGAVIWGCTWGVNSCFESHATQPRYTLIDNCRGGFMPYRAGGDGNQLPNHLKGLTIWNFSSMTASPAFVLWDSGGYYVRPVVVGFSPSATPFTQMGLLGYSEAMGESLTAMPSLYEAQLKLRLGYVPAWLNSLK